MLSSRRVPPSSVPPSSCPPADRSLYFHHLHAAPSLSRIIASWLPFLLNLGPPNLLDPPKHVVGVLLRVHASGLGASPVRRLLEHPAFPARLGKSASDLALAHTSSSSSSSFSL